MMQGETTLAFAAGHPAFAGHFPGRPIVPGVLLLDAALHAARQAQAAGTPAAAGWLSCRISSAKFLSPVGPDELLTVSWKETEGGSIRFDIAGDGRQVATGSFVFSAA